MQLYPINPLLCIKYESLMYENCILIQRLLIEFKMSFFYDVIRCISISRKSENVSDEEDAVEEPILAEWNG